MIKSLYLLIPIAVLISCSKPEKPPYQIPKEAIEFIAGNSSKTWKLARRFNNQTRMNMGDCFLNYRQVFTRNMTMTGGAENEKECGEKLAANWKITKDKKGHYYVKLTSDQIPKLLNIQEDHKYFKILEISKNQMVLQFTHRQFSDKCSTITDVYVTEGTIVEDRDFHW